MSTTTWNSGEDIDTGGGGCVSYGLLALAAIGVAIIVLAMIGPMLASTSLTSAILPQAVEAQQTLASTALTMYTSLGVAYSPHAERHEEAPAIRDCLDQRGPYMVLKHVSAPTFYLVCQIDKITWGLQAVDESGVEKTAFSPGNGTFQDVMDYLNKFTNKFKGTLPWMNAP